MPQFNQNALNDAFNLFSKRGYKGSINDFVSLIRTNENALKDSYSLFARAGYQGDGNAFMELIGVKDAYQYVGDEEIDEEEEEKSKFKVYIFY